MPADVPGAAARHSARRAGGAARCRSSRAGSRRRGRCAPPPAPRRSPRARAAAPRCARPAPAAAPAPSAAAGTRRRRCRSCGPRNGADELRSVEVLGLVHARRRAGCSAACDLPQPAARPFGVGASRAPATRTNSGSRSTSRSRVNAWLVAGCDSPRRLGRAAHAARRWCTACKDMQQVQVDVTDIHAHACYLCCPSAWIGVRSAAYSVDGRERRIQQPLAETRLCRSAGGAPTGGSDRRSLRGGR